MNDVSSSAVGNLSMVDIGSDDIEGATTLALNMTKSNDMNSACTRKTPKNATDIKQKVEKNRAQNEEQKKG